MGLWNVNTQAQLRVMSYNVENFFDNRHDSLHNDLEWTTQGARRWSYTRFQHKALNIAQVIANVGEWDTVGIIGLCEVENERCCKTLCYMLRRYHYAYIHYESEDERGIDVALLYDSLQFKPYLSQPLHVDLGEDKTRDILYVAGVCTNGDTLHVMQCHLPSMLGGKIASDWKRKRAKQVIQTCVDSILISQPHARIVVMGDMNSEPQDDIRGLKNRMIALQKRHEGSHRWQGVWSCLDQFYVSEAIDSVARVYIYKQDFLLEEDRKYLDKKPFRTFYGYKYRFNGYSDHLPIVLEL